MSRLQDRRQRLSYEATVARSETRSDTGWHSINIPRLNEAQAQKSIAIRLADTDGQRSFASMLINRMYSWRGYGSDHSLSSRSGCVTFTASADEQLIGTLTLTVDSPAGLAVDKTFREEIEPFRNAPGSKLCELTKFAFDADGPSKPVLAALFHIIFIYGSRRFDCSDLFIEVNPRHCRFYEIMLGFKRVGALKTNEAVNAPSQLMWLKVSDIRRHIDRQGSDLAHRRSLYPHFFSLKEEHGIYARLTSSTADAAHSMQPARFFDYDALPAIRPPSGGAEAYAV